MKSKILSKEVLRALSPYETTIIKVMKPNQNYDTKKIYKLIIKKRKIAKSSVSILLDRLYQKGLVTRDIENYRGKIKFEYKLNMNKEAYERKIVDSAVNLFIQKFGNKAINYFNESLKNRSKKK